MIAKAKNFETAPKCDIGNPKKSMVDHKGNYKTFMITKDDTKKKSSSEHHFSYRLDNFLLNLVFPDQIIENF